MEQLAPYALTSLQRVKDLIWDPNSYLQPIGNVVNGSATINNVTPMTNIQVGQTISGAGIPSGTTIVSVGVGSVVISQNATANGTNTQLSIVNQPSAFDTELTRMINSATDWFESNTGRRFLLTQYLNDEMSGVSYRQRRIVLRNYPVFYKLIAGDLANGSNVVQNVSDMNGIAVGMAVFAPGVVTTGQPGTMIQQNGAVVTTVTAVNSGAKTITLSLNASYTQLQANIQISGLVELDYMGGTPVTNPAWTPYIPDQYKLKDYGRAGIIRVYGLIQRIYDSSIRATYWAGYLINWANAGDNATHTLPADISGAVESMVVRRFKRRQSGDLNSISFGGSNNSWDKDIPLEVKDALNRYRRAPIYF